MSALRLLLLVALVAVTKANLANRVVPEEQFYDQATEDAQAAEQATTDSDRTARAATEDTKFGSIGDLLDSLLTSIGNEQTACQTQFDTDSTTCTDTQTDARALCEKTHTDALTILQDDATQKRQVCTEKTTTHTAKLAIMDKEQIYNNMITAQRDQSVASLTYLTAHAGDELSSCEANAAANFGRVKAYINDAHTANTQYLDEAGAMVDSIEAQVADLQSQTGSGTDARFATEAPVPTPTPTPTWTPTPVSLFQKMPMAQRAKLKMLQIKYVAGDRTLDQASDFSQLFTDIRTSIQSQREATNQNQLDDLAQAQTENDAELARCATEQSRTVAAITTRHDNLQSEKGASDARLSAAINVEGAARQEMNTACAAADAAEELLRVQIPILQQAHDDCDTAADAAYDSCQAAADGELQTCTDYLTSERTTVQQIQNINAHLGSQQVAGAALLQAASRFIRQVAKRNSKGKVQMPMLYTTDLSKYSGIKDQIVGLITDMKSTANADITTENNRAVTLHGDNTNNRDTLKSNAEQALVDCIAEQDALVLAAKGVRDAKQTVLTAKIALYDAADAACTTAQTVHATAVETQTREVAVCTTTRDDALTAADQAFDENMQLATSKRDTSLQYLTEETGTVAELRTALADLGDATDCATDLLQKGTLTAEQTQAIVSLLTLSGKSQYDVTQRAGYTAGQHTQTCRIEELLQSIEADIAAEVSTANSNFDLDSTDIQNDKDEAYAEANRILAACEKQYQDIVDAAEADMNQKCDVELPAATAARDAAQGEFDEALRLYNEAEQTRTETIAICTQTRDDALTEADSFYSEREGTINGDHSAEIARLNATIEDCDEILQLVNGMTFTAQELLQAKAKGVDENSYRSEDSGDEKANMIGLIESLQAQVATERTRSDDEYLKDNAANEAEKTRADNHAASVAQADLDSLQAAVDAARAAKVAAEPELADATTAHDEASKVHNANMDTRATAEQIQSTNLPNFQADLEETKQVAAEILAKQQELHLKCTLSRKYLEITEGYVNLIKTAASSVNIDPLAATTTTTVSVEDAYMAAGTSDMIADAHQMIKAQLAKETDAERERCRLQGVDNPGCHDDEVGTTAWDHDTHTDVADHTDTTGMGENQQYDANGEAVSRRLLQSDDQSDDQGPPQDDQGPTGPQTLGSVIDAILSHISDEQGRVNDECDAQEQEFTAQHVDTLSVAQDHYDAQIKEDTDRLEAAQTAEAASFTVLQTALARKENAQAVYDEKAATLRDALATQAKYVPIVNQKKADSLATNTERYTNAAQTIEASKTSADAKYDEQENLLAEVKTQIEDGLNKVELLQSLATVVKKIVKTRLYDFTIGSADDFEDKADGNYHNNGQNATNSEEYTGDTSTLTGMINSLIAQNTNQLEVVKTTSTADMAAKADARDTRITNADSTLQAELNRLQQAANDAHGELVTAQAAEDAQKPIMDAAIADRVLKESNHAQTVEEGINRKTAALEKRTACVANAESAYDSELVAYASTLTTAQGVLAYEQNVVDQMRAAMNGEEFSASPEMQSFNHCTAEKTAADAAATECTDDKNACEESKIAGLNDGSERSTTTRRLLSNGCAGEAASCAAKGTTRAAYESCLGPSELLSTEELKAAFMQLHSKYASETAMTDTFSTHKTEMESILVEVESKIAAEGTAAQTQHDADVASSLAKKSSDVAACIAAEQAVIDKWDTKVADAQSAWDAAAAVEATEVAEFDRLVGVKNAKQAAYDAALQTQSTDGAIARALHKDDVDGAWEEYTNMHALITQIATSDYEYLTEELESLQTILDIVGQLNLDENTNGVFDADAAAAAHVTNTYATDNRPTAETKVAYHGTGINQENAPTNAPSNSPTSSPSVAPTRPPATCTMYMSGHSGTATYPHTSNTGFNPGYDNCGSSVYTVGDCASRAIYDNDGDREVYNFGASSGYHASYINLPYDLTNDCAGWSVSASPNGDSRY